MKTTSCQYGGLPVAGIQNTGVSRNLSISQTNKKRTSQIRKNNDKKLPKKHLNYNPREIRNALMLASKSESAGRVVCQAKGKLSSLLKCKGTGMYHERELSNAIVHARRMVQCAQMKNRNLKKEEQLQRGYEKEAEMEKQNKRREMKTKVQQKKRVLEQKFKMEKMQNVRRQKQHMEEMIRRKRIHRLSEQGKMNEADMEYQKNMNRDSGQNFSHVNNHTLYLPLEGVELELSEEAVAMTEEQLNHQVEMMIQAELGTMSAMPDLSSLPMADFASGSMESMGAELSMVDVAV